MWLLSLWYSVLISPRKQAIAMFYVLMGTYRTDDWPNVSPCRFAASSHVPLPAKLYATQHLHVNVTDNVFTAFYRTTRNNIECVTFFDKVCNVCIILILLDTSPRHCLKYLGIMLLRQIMKSWNACVILMCYMYKIPRHYADWEVLFRQSLKRQGWKGLYGKDIYENERIPKWSTGLSYWRKRLLLTYLLQHASLEWIALFLAHKPHETLSTSSGLSDSSW